ncbi:MAG TPA: helix-turn-helix transcriptional regulator [Thermotogota bacterium]|nr:helix-turn-helix transcriptional regulator [Thermotogota bacterium]
MLVMDMIETTGDRLRIIRKDRGLTQEKLAELAGVTQNSISAYEMNKANMSLEVARKISNVLGVSLDGLVGIGINKKHVDVVKEGLLDWDIEPGDLDGAEMVRSPRHQRNKHT